MANEQPPLAAIDDERERAQLAARVLATAFEVYRMTLEPIDWQQQGLQAPVVVNGTQLGTLLSVYNRNRTEDSFLTWLRQTLATGEEELLTSDQQPPRLHPSSPRILSQSSESRFVELSSSYAHPQYFNSVCRHELGLHTLGATLFQFDANEPPIKLELSTKEMITLVCSFLQFLVDFNRVRHDACLFAAFTAYRQASEQLTLDCMEKHPSDLDEYPW